MVGDGDEIALGSVRLKAIHTPGHTYEHVSWAVFDDTRSKETPWLVFTGDFLFVGDVGRPDLLGEEARKKLAHQLYESVFSVLPALPDFTEVYPAHGAGSLCGKALGSRSSTTLGFERRYNGALQPRPEPEWVAALLEGMPIAPPYFRRMKKVNAEGPKILGPEPPGRKAVHGQRGPRAGLRALPGGGRAAQGGVRRRPHPRLDQHPARPQPADLGRLGPALRPADPDRARTTRPTCPRWSRTCCGSASTTCRATSKAGWPTGRRTATSWAGWRRSRSTTSPTA